jgi:hypothetical protein
MLHVLIPPPPVIKSETGWFSQHARQGNAVLMTISFSYGKGWILTNCSAKTTQAITMKFWTFDYVNEFITPTKFGSNRFTGDSPGNMWNITSTFRFLSFFLPFFSSDTSTGQMACAMYISDTLNDRFWAKEVPFGGLINEKNFSRGNIPSPKFSKGILHANRKSRITLDR